MHSKSILMKFLHIFLAYLLCTSLHRRYHAICCILLAYKYKMLLTVVLLAYKILLDATLFLHMFAYLCMFIA